MLVSSHLHQHRLALNFSDLCQSGVSLEFCVLSNELPILLLVFTYLLVFPNIPSQYPGIFSGSILPLWQPGLEEKAHWDSGRSLDPRPATYPRWDLHQLPYTLLSHSLSPRKGRVLVLPQGCWVDELINGKVFYKL